MDSLYKLINDKRKELQQFKKGSCISQQELLNKEKEELLRKQKEQREAKEKLSYQKLEELEKRFERGNKRKLDQSETKPSTIEITKETTAEIYRKLRKLKLPIIIFAETPDQRYERLCRSEVALAGSNSSGSNINHDTLSKVDREFEHQLQALDNSLSDNNVKRKKSDEVNVDHKDISDIIKAKKISDWISKVLGFWENELSKQSSTDVDIGDLKSTTLLTQTRTGLEPLIKLLRKNKLDVSILDKLCKIVDCIENTDYRGAHDTYMMLAIGNAPWPMGVANITIQARPWKSRIYESEVAHVLNDDTTRKFIQMFKRLMTIAQRINPTSISKQVNMTTHIT